jgi:hypothetical protein
MTERTTGRKLDDGPDGDHAIPHPTTTSAGPNQRGEGAHR